MCYLLLVSDNSVIPDQGFLVRICRLISAMDGNLPNKPCKTCKNSFHASCLYEVRVLSACLISPGRQLADGRPPAFSGSRAATRLAALCVVPISLDRDRVWVNPVIRGYAYVDYVSIDRFPQDTPPTIVIYL